MLPLSYTSSTSSASGTSSLTTISGAVTGLVVTVGVGGVGGTGLGEGEGGAGETRPELWLPGRLLTLGERAMETFRPLEGRRPPAARRRLSLFC